MCLEIQGFITASYPQIEICLFLPPDHDSSALRIIPFQTYTTGMITSGREENTGFGFAPALQERRNNKSLLLGLSHAGVLGSFYITISLHFSPRAGRTKT